MTWVHGKKGVTVALMKLQDPEMSFDSQAPEKTYTLSLAKSDEALEMDFSDCPSLVVEILDFQEAIGLDSPQQAGLLVNDDTSLWLTNLGRSGSTELYRPENKKHRRLSHQQVGHMREGDLVGFYGRFYRLEFDSTTLTLRPLPQDALKFLP